MSTCDGECQLFSSAELQVDCSAQESAVSCDGTGICKAVNVTETDYSCVDKTRQEKLEYLGCTSRLGDYLCPCVNPVALGLVPMQRGLVYYTGGASRRRVFPAEGILVPADYASFCKQWDIGKETMLSPEDCNSATNPTVSSWCRDAWCYVDICNCDLGDAAISSYFPENELAYSYQTCAKCSDKKTKEACDFAGSSCMWAAPLSELSPSANCRGEYTPVGSEPICNVVESTYLATICKALTLEDNCKAEKMCTWLEDSEGGTAATCDVLPVEQRQANYNCPAMLGSDRCSCLDPVAAGYLDPAAVDNGLLTIYPPSYANSGKKVPADLGSRCAVWESISEYTAFCKECVEKHQEYYQKTVEVVPQWCLDKWCFVDPCTCGAIDVLPYSFFKPEHLLQPLGISYSTCAQCHKIVFRETCIANSWCKWVAANLTTDGIPPGLTSTKCGDHFRMPPETGKRECPDGFGVRDDVTCNVNDCSEQMDVSRCCARLGSCEADLAVSYYDDHCLDNRVLLGEVLVINTTVPPFGFPSEGVWYSREQITRDNGGINRSVFAELGSLTRQQEEPTCTDKYNCAYKTEWTCQPPPKTGTQVVDAESIASCRGEERCVARTPRDRMIEWKCFSGSAHSEFAAATAGKSGCRCIDPIGMGYVSIEDVMLQPEGVNLSSHWVSFAGEKGANGEWLDYPRNVSSEYGTFCSTWDMGTSALFTKLCNAGVDTADNGWCRMPWCYVDPCSCDLDDVYRPSRLEVSSDMLALSWKTCSTCSLRGLAGNRKTIAQRKSECEDQVFGCLWDIASVSCVVDETKMVKAKATCRSAETSLACNSDANCMWDGQLCISRASVLGASSLTAATAQCPRLVGGAAGCKCISPNEHASKNGKELPFVTQADGTLRHIGADGTETILPSDFGSYCSAWDSGATSIFPQDSADTWCFVDPCTCSASDVLPANAAFKQPNGFQKADQVVAVSTMTCAQCPGRINQRACEAHSQCVWVEYPQDADETMLKAECKEKVVGAQFMIEKCSKLQICSSDPICIPQDRQCIPKSTKEIAKLYDCPALEMAAAGTCSTILSFNTSGTMNVARECVPSSNATVCSADVEDNAFQKAQFRCINEEWIFVSIREISAAIQKGMVSVAVMVFYILHTP